MEQRSRKRGLSENEMAQPMCPVCYEIHGDWIQCSIARHHEAPAVESWVCLNVFNVYLTTLSVTQTI
jgi:hypothetical protein